MDLTVRIATIRSTPECVVSLPPKDLADTLGELSCYPPHHPPRPGSTIVALHSSSLISPM
jgi:hypothetical protein